jgi:polyisoprenoid-binding protein YceI
METLVKTSNPTAVKWNLDTAHSNLEFSVKHMMISTVKGSFKNFNIDLTSDNDDFSNSNVEVEITVDSIHTGQENREVHLKSADFFDSANFPAATFKSTAIEKAEDGLLKVNGDLTIKGITKPVTVNVEFNGKGTDPYGNEKAGFEFNATINRADFGLNWNVPLETGGVLVSNNVKIYGGLQFAKQKVA